MQTCPLIGGSILTHDHYQEGATPLPYELAVEESFSVEGFEAVSLGIVNLAHVGSPVAIR